MYKQDNLVIRRIEGGVPLVQAESLEDILFGLGYCHGIDRGMQLIMTKILAHGKATEHLADTDEMLEIDLFFRQMNWFNNTKEEINKFDESEIKLLQAYTDGINKAFKKIEALGIKTYAWIQSF